MYTAMDSKRRQRRIMHGKLKVCLLEIRTAAGYMMVDIDNELEDEIRRSLNECCAKLQSVVRGLGIRGLTDDDKVVKGAKK
jgi:hypothetical protein